jgi:hypothetical protein
MNADDADIFARRQPERLSCKHMTKAKGKAGQLFLPIGKNSSINDISGLRLRKS